MRIGRSMGANGSAHGNALAERFFSNLNNERMHHGVLDIRETTRAALFTCIETFCKAADGFTKHSAIKRIGRIRSNFADNVVLDEMCSLIS